MQKRAIAPLVMGVYMPERDYTASPVADSLGLRDVILGLATDLKDLRAGKISTQDAQARAAVAKQMFNGVRLYLQAMRSLEGAAKPVAATPGDPQLIEGQTQ